MMYIYAQYILYISGVSAGPAKAACPAHTQQDVPCCAFDVYRFVMCTPIVYKMRDTCIVHTRVQCTHSSCVCPLYTKKETHV